jgi:Fe-S-cluster containining protein
MQFQKESLDDLARHYEPELKSHFLNLDRAISRIQRDGGAPSDIAKRAAEMFDSVNAKAQAKGGYKADCKEGCAYCCCITVQVTSQEVELLAKEIRSKLNADEIAALKEKMREVIAARAEGKRPRCPLLTEGERCGFYEVRPISCRMCNSPDSNECKTYELTGVETPRKFYALSKLFAGYTQASAFVAMNPGKDPNYMLTELEMLAELLKVL